MDNKELSSYLETVSTVIIAVILFFLPLFFLLNTTDFFIIPKQLLIISGTCVLLLLWGLKALVEKKITFNANPLNLPIIIFTSIVLVSAIISGNRYDALFQTIPFIFAVIFFYLLINTVREGKSFSMVLAAYFLGGAASAIVSIAYYMKIYFLPFTSIQNQLFNTFGSSVQQLIYLLPMFIFSVFYIGKRLNFPNFRISENTKSDFTFFIHMLASLAILGGIVLILYQIVALPDKPIILPYVYGFQTALASISQDRARFILSLLFGSGFGTFLVDFTRYKLASFNLEQNIWSLAFSYSSSFFLELVATTGLLGGLSFLAVIATFIRTRVAKNPLFIAIATLFVLSIVLPFSYINVVAMLVMLAIYCAYLNIEGDRRVYDVVLSLIANPKGMLSFEATPEERVHGKSESPILPAVVFLLIILIVGFLGYFTFKFALSDTEFAASLSQAAQNNGQATYQLETRAISNFPYRSDYHRIFSQVNLALANSLAAGIKPGTQPSAQVQQNIVTLLQQSINSARNAVMLSPLTSINWQNLSQIYRSLINVGQNAEQFSIASMNQAVALDPYNPQLYVQLGGIYYQLKQWDQAQNQFQLAINLKRDFANAYYNYGHALEEKGDLQNALSAYQIVKQLSANNKQNSDQINSEIATLEEKIGKQKLQAGSVTPQTEQPPLSISQPTTNLPEQNPQIKISPPPSGTQQATSSAQ